MYNISFQPTGQPVERLHWYNQNVPKWRSDALDGFSLKMRFNGVTLHVEDLHIMATSCPGVAIPVVIRKVYGVQFYDF